MAIVGKIQQQTFEVQQALFTVTVVTVVLCLPVVTLLSMIRDESRRRQMSMTTFSLAQMCCKESTIMSSLRAQFTISVAKVTHSLSLPAS